MVDEFFNGMRVRYVKPGEEYIPTEKFRHIHEASRKAAILAHFEAYRLAKAYGTPLVGWDEEKNCITYIDANKYSFEEIRAGKFEGDPSIYIKPESPSPAAACPIPIK